MDQFPQMAQIRQGLSWLYVQFSQGSVLAGFNRQTETGNQFFGIADDMALADLVIQ